MKKIAAVIQILVFCIVCTAVLAAAKYLQLPAGTQKMPPFMSRIATGKNIVARSASAGKVAAAEKDIAFLRTFSSVNHQSIVTCQYREKGGVKNAKPDESNAGWQTIMLPNKYTGSFGWYRMKINPEKINGFSTAGGKVSLNVSVDNTAEVYVDGVMMKMIPDSGSLDITSKIKPGKMMTIVLKVTVMRGVGGLNSASLHAEALDPLQRSFTNLLGKLNDARAMLDQVPETPKSVVDAYISVAAEGRKLREIKDFDALKAKFDELEKTLKPVDEALAKYPLFLKGPYLQNARTNAMTIMWETRVPSDSAVYYGEKGYEKKVVDTQKKTVHEITINGLKIQTKYRYVAVSSKQAAPASEFRTAIRRDTPFKFEVWGDSRTDAGSHESVVDAMIPHKPDIAINVGDVVTHGVNLDEWGREYFEPMRRLGINTPTYIALGNHEYGGFGYGKKVKWFEQFVSHPGDNKYYYAFTYGNSRFVVLDPLQASNFCCDLPTDSEERAWLIKEFESDEYNKATFQFVFLHEPPYSECWSGGYYDGEPGLRANLVPLLEKYGVDIVFAGHTHDYERGQWPKPDGPYYIITGGGGAELDNTKYKEWDQIDIYKFVYHFTLISINGNHLRLDAIDRDGKVFDTFEIHKKAKGK